MPTSSEPATTQENMRMASADSGPSYMFPVASIAHDAAELAQAHADARDERKPLFRLGPRDRKYRSP